ncbi:MAG: nuclear transport factor 2 family protein [Beijerinckiaceae bacterium]
MKSLVRLTFAVAMLANVLILAPNAKADTASEVIATYNNFAAAQNARDLARVKDLLLDSPSFLWVSDGKSIWGRDALIARMSKFQTLEVWHVEPLLDKARVVEINGTAAYLHMPLDLFLGAANSPSRTRFLVSVLCAKTDTGWRIAALFTTLDNPD